MRVLVLSLLFLWGCTLTTKFDEDPQGNNTPTTESACRDGIDNDGDSQTDCKDPDCDTDPSCTTPSCTSPDLYAMQPEEHDPVCPQESFCRGEYDFSSHRITTSCVTRGLVSPVEFFATCGEGRPCPLGSSCVDSGVSGDAYCQPWCSSAYPECPQRSLCGIPDNIVLNIDENTLFPCIQEHHCVPLSGESSCGNDSYCVPIIGTDETYCQRLGFRVLEQMCVLNTRDENSACDNNLVCVPNGGGVLGYCYLVCDRSNGTHNMCSGGTCTSYTGISDHYGLCTFGQPPGREKRR